MKNGGGHPHPGERTKWYSMRERPIRPGDYECRRVPRDKVVRTWDGKRWRNPESGLTLMLELYGGWRGLREQAR